MPAADRLADIPNIKKKTDKQRIRVEKTFEL